MERIRFYKTSTTLFLLACLAAIFAISLSYFANRPAAEKDQGSKKNFAVVELFTSEGCAACPPAHELLAKIQNEHAGKNIYTLAYHVHFWDREKWKDQFSNVEYSKRQLSYAEWLNVPNVYAPQIVINGKSQFAGTNESKIRRSINESLTIPRMLNFNIQGAQDGEKLIVNYKVKGSSTAMYLQLAIVKKSSAGEVEEGDHKGHAFTHVQTVHALHSKQLTREGKGIFIVKIPREFNATKWEVIAIIQDLTHNGEILAARKVDL